MDIIKAINESEVEIIVAFREAIGAENVATLIRVCGGTQFYLPQMETVLKDERNKAIYTDFCNESSLRTIASEYRISEMTVRDIIRKERKIKRELTE